MSRSRWHLRVVVGLWIMGWLSWLAFGQNSSGVAAKFGMLLCLLFVGVIAMVGWKNSPVGSLQWDGEHWHWSGAGQTDSCRLVRLLDFQALMVVRLAGDSGAPTYLWLETASPKDVQWLALRRAIAGTY